MARVNRSSRANRYGTLAERWAADRYGFVLERTEWHDGKRGETPIQVKAAMRNRSSGSPGRFRLWEDQHRELSRTGGVYVFVEYRARGRGISVIRSREIRARDLRVTFYGAGGHRNSRQVKISPSEIF